MKLTRLISSRPSTVGPTVIQNVIAYYVLGYVHRYRSRRCTSPAQYGSITTVIFIQGEKMGSRPVAMELFFCEAIWRSAEITRVKSQSRSVLCGVTRAASAAVRGRQRGWLSCAGVDLACGRSGVSMLTLSFVIEIDVLATYPLSAYNCFTHSTRPQLKLIYRGLSFEF